MKVYFSATITGGEGVRKRYEHIIDLMKKHGAEVKEYGSSSLTPHELINRSDDEIVKVHKQLDQLLKSTDVYVAEISEPSVGIGYEISQAIALRKPVLALQYKKSEFQPLATIQGLKSKFITYAQYDDENVAQILERFLRDAKNKMDTKFILIISPEIDKYLQWASEHKRMHKAQIVRNAVEQQMEEDDEWKEVQSEK